MHIPTYIYMYTDTNENSRHLYTYWPKTAICIYTQTSTTIIYLKQMQMVQPGYSHNTLKQKF